MRAAGLLVVRRGSRAALLGDFSTEGLRFMLVLVIQPATSSAQALADHPPGVMHAMDTLLSQQPPQTAAAEAKKKTGAAGEALWRFVGLTLGHLDLLHFLAPAPPSSSSRKLE